MVLADLIRFIPSLQLLREEPNGASLNLQDSPSIPPVGLQGRVTTLNTMPAPLAITSADMVSSGSTPVLMTKTGNNAKAGFLFLSEKILKNKDFHSLASLTW